MTILNDPRRDDPCPPVASAAPASSPPFSSGSAGAPSDTNLIGWFIWFSRIQSIQGFNTALDLAEEQGILRDLLSFAVGYMAFDMDNLASHHARRAAA